MAIYVVDTNIILEDPNYIFTLGDEHTIFLLNKVLKELDSKKHLDGILGYNARLFAKLLRDSEKKNITLHDCLSVESTDDALIAFANNIPDTVLLTNDNYMLAKAKLRSVKTFSPKLKELNQSYTGVTKIELDDEQIQEFHSGQPLVLSAIQEDGLYPNQILIFTQAGEESAVGFALYCGYDKPVKRLPSKYEMSGITAKNKEQIWLMQLGDLLAKKENSIDLLTIEGQAGTGKTLLALCIAINLMDKHGYKTITLTKPVAHVGDRKSTRLNSSHDRLS
jgi:PhoH-like ATPase